MAGARVASGDRVTFRTVEPDDYGFVQRAYANPEIRYAVGNPLSRAADLEEWLDDDDDRFLVCLDDDATPGSPNDDSDLRRVGVVSVTNADWKRPALAYWLVPEVHGQGYGTEAVGLAIHEVFRIHDAPAIGAGAYGSNDASRGLLESLGFEQEGRHRRHRFVDGEYRDLIQYGLLRETWEAGED
jgi:ribosomal-protein-alanine N-acetyltransferase